MPPTEQFEREDPGWEEDDERRDPELSLYTEDADRFEPAWRTTIMVAIFLIAFVLAVLYLVP